MAARRARFPTRAPTPPCGLINLVSRPSDAERRIRIAILGVGIDPVTSDEAVRRVSALIAAGRPAHVVTVNPEFVMAARRDPRFAAVLEAADLALADGVGVVWAARLLGTPVPERVPGVDIVPRLACAAAELGRSVFLLGAAPGVAPRAAEALTAYGCGSGPGVRIAGTEAGSPDAGDAAAIIARVTAADPGLLLVAFGAPRQDLWIAAHRDDLRVPVMMGVGGTFDMLAGVQRRAPRVVRGLGLEWLWRLVLEPARWRRQLALPRFAVAVLASAVRIRSE